MKDKVNKIKISPDASIKTALKKINEAGMAMLFVCTEDGVLLGSLSDGDIRRRILKTGNLQEKIANCFNPNPIFVKKEEYTPDSVKNIMLKKTINVIPIIDEGKKILDILFWKDIFEEEFVSFKKIDIPVVIMAGGRGERLGFFTKIFPKPLVPINEKPIIEIIMDKFRRCGAALFYITLNYKGEMIKTYFDSSERGYKIEYVWEKEFLGTAGSLKLIPDNPSDDLIVSNCDVIIDTDYGDLVDFHKEHDNSLTVVGSIQHHKIPYGIINFESGGRIKNIQEKPELDFTINTGLYVLSQRALKFIPADKCFDMTDLIKVLLGKNESVGVYPVSQESYVDIGQWGEYKKALEKLQFLK